MEKTLRNKALMSSYLGSYGKGFLVTCLRADRSATSQKYFICRLRIRYEGYATRKAQEVLFKWKWRPSCCLGHRHYCSTFVSIGTWDTKSSRRVWKMVISFSVEFSLEPSFSAKVFINCWVPQRKEGRANLSCSFSSFWEPRLKKASSN